LPGRAKRLSWGGRLKLLGDLARLGGLFTDHVHPTIRVQRIVHSLIANAADETLRALRLLSEEIDGKPIAQIT